MKNLPPIYYQTAGIYYPAALTVGRLANPLPICYRHRRICYRSSQPATESTDNRPTHPGNHPIHQTCQQQHARNHVSHIDADLDEDNYE